MKTKGKPLTIAILAVLLTASIAMNAALLLGIATMQVGVIYDHNAEREIAIVRINNINFVRDLPVEAPVNG